MRNQIAIFTWVIVGLLALAGCSSTARGPGHYAGEFGDQWVADVPDTNNTTIRDASDLLLSPGALISVTTTDSQLIEIAKAYRAEATDLMPTSFDRNLPKIVFIIGTVGLLARMAADLEEVYNHEETYRLAGGLGVTLQALGLVGDSRIRGRSAKAQQLMDWAEIVDVYRTARSE